MESIRTAQGHAAWNMGKLVGQKAPFKLKEIWAIRIRLQMQDRLRRSIRSGDTLTSSRLCRRRAPLDALLHLPRREHRDHRGAHHDIADDGEVFKLAAGRHC